MMGGLSARAFTTAAAAAIVAVTSASPGAADPQIDRGQYLASFGGCLDCHTRGYFFGKPDMERFLGGSDVGFEISAART